jgi:hypothetical protein
MFPKHCREVGVKKITFPLTENNIITGLIGQLAYKKTDYLILINGDERAIVRIEKPQNEELFSQIEEVKVISLPDNTKYLEDPSINVLSPTQMAETAQKQNAETLVVKGMFEHISFIHKEEPIPLVVYDVIPPEPPKLMKLVRNALYSGSVGIPVKIIPNIQDLREITKNCTKNNIIFPCHASDLRSEKKTFYLDQDPEFQEDELSDVCLIGCDLSLRIFKILYNIEPEFFNFCPKMRTLDEKPKYKTITKCCELKEGFERMGNIVVVPWGATQKEVEDALNELFELKENLNLE